MYLDDDNNCGNTGNANLWHRGCCHKIDGANEDYLSPLQDAVDKGLELCGKLETVQKAKKISHLLSK